MVGGGRKLGSRPERLLEARPGHSGGFHKDIVGKMKKVVQADQASSPMTVNARVKKHRAKLQSMHCRRLEVYIGITVIENVQELAKRNKIRMWEAVQDALEAYVSGHTETQLTLNKT